MQIMRFTFVPLLLYTIQAWFGKCSGISFVDSTSVKACDNHRIRTHHLFSKYAKRGKSSVG
ncbi:MAG: transposase [Oscillospiraceae bacterium]|nr:transposase [Oscillospiraceae bacterium]